MAQPIVLLKCGELWMMRGRINMMFDYTLSKRELQRGYEFLIKLYNNADPYDREMIEHIRQTVNYVASLKGVK